MHARVHLWLYVLMRECLQTCVCVHAATKNEMQDLCAVHQKVIDDDGSSGSGGCSGGGGGGSDNEDDDNEDDDDHDSPCDHCAHRVDDDGDDNDDGDDDDGGDDTGRG